MKNPISLQEFAILINKIPIKNGETLGKKKIFFFFSLSLFNLFIQIDTYIHILSLSWISIFINSSGVAVSGGVDSMTLCYMLNKTEKCYYNVMTYATQ